MNLKVIIPKTWKPECKNSLQQWFDKIHKEAIKSRY